MRTDILIDNDIKDIVITESVDYKPLSFNWIENPSGSAQYVYGEIEIPISIAATDNIVRQLGFYVAIPRMPQYKEVMVRIKRVGEDGTYSLVANKFTPIYAELQDVISGENYWFLIKRRDTDKAASNAFASELITLSQTNFFVILEDDYAAIYAPGQDFIISQANGQNTDFLLACVPGNNYRYPLSGVGIVRFINSNNSGSKGLGDLLVREFSEDGVQINSVALNHATSQLEIEINETQ